MIFNDIMMIMILEWVIFSVDSAFEIRSVLILLSHLKWSSALCSLSLALFNDMRVFRCASTSSTYPCQFVRRFVRSSYFRISLSPHKASRRHCGGRHGGTHGGWHGGGQGDRQDGRHVGDMEVDKADDMTADIQNEVYEAWNVLKQSVLGRSCLVFNAKCTRLSD